MSSYLYGSYITDNSKDNKLVVESINSICESTVCSIKPLDEEYVVVNEIYFSKKDLQDPETFKKLLKRAEVEKDVKKKLDILFYCLTFAEAIVGTVAISKATKSASGIISDAIEGVMPGVFIGLFVLFIKITHKVVSKLDKAILYIHKARINKLIKKATELRDKTKQSNPQVSANCQKLLDSIDKYYKEVENVKFKKLVEEIKQDYNFLVRIIHAKDCIENPGHDAFNIFAIAHDININYSLIDKGQIEYGTKLCKEKTSDIYKWMFGPDGANKNDKELLSRYMPEFKDIYNTEIVVFYAIDDTMFMYSPKGKIYYYGDYEIGHTYFYKNMYDIIKHNMDINAADKNYMEALKVADAELGYYRLTPAPEGVTPKKI